MSGRNRCSISVSEAHYERITKLAESLGTSRSALVEFTVERALAAAPAPAPAPRAPDPEPTPDPNLVELEIGEELATAAKALDATILHYDKGREIIASPAFEAAIEAAISLFERNPPKNTACVICTDDLTTATRRLYLLDAGVFAWICVRCDDQHPRDPNAPRFDGGEGGDGAEPSLSLASGGNLAERGRVRPRIGR